MRIAVLADIHGNIPALEAVLAAVDAAQVDEVLVGGDLVGRGPQGRRVVEIVRGRGWHSIRGNHEEYLLAFRRGEVPREWLELEEWSASRWMAAELDSEALGWIASLPFSMSAALSHELELVHGSPRSTQEGIGPWLDDASLGRMVAGVRGRVLLCGHTHRPMVRTLGDRSVVNVGSVGLSFDGDRRACWVLCTRPDGDGPWQLEPQRVEWELEELRRIYLQTGFLAAGGVTAELLWLEHVHARPWLVPFLAWCDAVGHSPRADRLEPFVDFYRPEESLGSFHQRVAELAGARANSPRT